MNASEIVTRVEKLPTLPVVIAKDMMFAQGWKPTDSERAAINARADFFQDMGMTRDVHIRVEDVYTGAKIGELIFRG